MARQSDIDHLEQRVARLEMVCEAMWNLIRDKTQLTDAQLHQQVARLDLSDGKADGRVSKGPLDCPQCRKTNARRHEFCMWCGTVLRTSPFD